MGRRAGARRDSRFGWLGGQMGSRVLREEWDAAEGGRIWSGQVLK